MKLSRRHLRRLIKEELTKKLLSESQFRESSPEYDLNHRVKVFLNYGNSYRETKVRGDIGSASGTYDATTADEWERTEPWFNDALMFRMTLDSIDTFYRTTNHFTDFSEVYNKTPQELADFLLERIKDAKVVLSEEPKPEFIYEPQAISRYLDEVAKKLNDLKDSTL